MGDNVAALGTLVSKLGRLTRLTEADRTALSSLPITLRGAGNASHLVREGDAVRECCLLVEGYACRHKLAAGGGRQIVSFHLTGDLLDVQHLLLDVADHNVQAITPVTIGWIPRDALRRLAKERPAIGAALWKDSLIDASIFREWVLNVGRRDALSRIAHMLCEFAARCEAAGLGSFEQFHLPMTQEHIADATGLTSVHVNRMLRTLDREGVLVRAGRDIRIADGARLRSLAEFSPLYLHEAA